MSNTGYGTGTGNGHGYGNGYGDGYGYGHGTIIATIAGYSTIITTIAGHDVCGHTPFAVVSVGCETHTIDHWRNNWREIAEKHEVDVTEEDVERVFTKIKGEDQ